MGKLFGKKRLQTGIAWLAILLNALAPSLSHAWSSVAGPSSMIDICSAGGTRWIDGAIADELANELASVVSGPQAGPQQPSTDAPLHHGEHCPFCITHAGNFVLPGASTTLPAIKGGHDVLPALFYPTPSPLFCWSLARPRGPPALS